MPMVPLARYEDRYTRAIGKWLLNAANAARLFYADEHSPQTQSSEFWTGDPQSSVAYEGLRHHWLGGEFDGEELYAAGDPLTYGWGPQTDFGIYGSAVSGVFGSIIKTTNVEKILQLDLLAADFYRDAAHKTYLYYNPHPTNQSVAIDLGTGQFDLYDAIANRFVARSATGPTSFNVPKDNAVMLVLVPAGETQTRVGRQLISNGVVIDYNATLLPDNLARNPDVDSPQLGNAPTNWLRSTNATWSSTTALSPTHSLELIDNNTTRSEEWRTYATNIPDGTNRQLDLRWFWKYNVAEGSEFRARLRLSTDPAFGIDLTNPTTELNFTISGTSADFSIFESSLAIADTIRSFDLTFMTGGAIGATGSLYIDDISAAISTVASLLVGDYNNNGVVDAADYVVWRKYEGTNNPLPNDMIGGTIGTAHYAQWRSHFGQTPGSSVSATVPEPVASMLLLMLVGMSLRRNVLPQRSKLVRP
jgi:hypothetical protein